MAKNMGIELMRLVSMGMIVILHILGIGGVLEHAAPGIAYYTYYLLEVLAFVCVNCFVLITGFFYTKTFKLKKIIALYLEVLCYSLAITAVCSLLGYEVDWVASLFYISSRQYWFIGAFIGLMLMTPFLAVGIDTVDKSNFTIILVIFGLIATVGTIFLQTDAFNVSRGSSLIWFIYVYLIGAYMKKYKITMKRTYAIGAYIAFSLLTLFTIYRLQDIKFMDNHSITVLAASIALFCFFQQLEIKGSKSTAIIALLSKNTLPVYLIHTNRYIYYNILAGSFVFVTTLPLIVGVVVVLGGALSIFVLSILVSIIVARTNKKMTELVTRLDVKNRKKEKDDIF